MAEVTERTILVPIDMHGINRGTLETLVTIARQLDRGVLGLLLEDIRLQRVADLPFTTEITLTGARERNLLRDHLSQRYSQVNSDTRRLLNELAARDRVRLRFEDAAGPRWHTALQREGQLDIFFPAREMWHPRVDMQRYRGGLIKRLGILLPTGDQAAALLDCAAALLRAGLVGDVYVLSGRRLVPEQLQALYRPGHQVRVQANFDLSPDSIAALIRYSPYDLLLLPRDCLQGIGADSIDAALEKSGTQILVIN